MPDKIVVNVRPYAGEYDFDYEGEPLTTLEWRWVKKISGYMPMTIDEGIRGLDPDVFLALAVICLVRAGRVEKAAALHVAERLADAPVDGNAISYVGGEVEDDPPAGPAATPETGTRNGSGGGSSRSTSDLSENVPSRTGTPDSETSAIYGLATSPS